MINKILTTPRSGMNMSVPGVNGLQVGGGIAGFASTFEAPSIKVYNDRQKYNEWEFMYDMKKDKRLLGAAAGAAQACRTITLSADRRQVQTPTVPNPVVNPGGAQGTPNPNPFGGAPQAPNFPQPGRR